MANTRKYHIVAAAEARCNLNAFYGVIALLEAGTITGRKAQGDAERIINICKIAAGRQLAVYDREVDAASQEPPHVD